jgi:hypothetical protein
MDAPGDNTTAVDRIIVVLGLMLLLTVFLLLLNYFVLPFYVNVQSRYFRIRRNMEKHGDRIAHRTHQLILFRSIIVEWRVYYHFACFVFAVLGIVLSKYL